MTTSVSYEDVRPDPEALSRALRWIMGNAKAAFVDPIPAVQEAGEGLAETVEGISLPRRPRSALGRSGVQGDPEALARAIEFLTSFSPFDYGSAVLSGGVGALGKKLIGAGVKKLLPKIARAYEAEVVAGGLRNARIPNIWQRFKDAGGKASPEEFREAVEQLARESGGAIAHHDVSGTPGVAEAMATAGFKADPEGRLPFYLFVPGGTR